MNTLLRIWVAGALASCTMLSAQNFNGSDDFSSTTAYWGADNTSTGGMFTVDGGVLKFTDSGITFGQTSSAARNWTLNAGSYAADWQVQVDVNLGILTQVGGQVTTWALRLASSVDSTDAAQITFQQNYMQPTMRNLNGQFFTDNVAGTPGSTVASTNTITMHASFLAASHTLSLGYDAGFGYSNLLSAVVDGTGLGWGMGLGDTFNLNLRAYNVTTGAPTSALGLGSGVYADNFFASPTAVPEPSTYAACAGLAALGLALIRRRARL